MIQYIDKDAIVAEIEKIIADETESIKFFEHSKNSSELQRSNARIGLLEYIHSLLDTIEVKEVDLEKEIEKYLKQYNMLAVGKKEFTDIAKHFFELGLKA